MDDEHDDSQLTDEERARLYREQLKRLRTIDLVQDMMVSLVTIGYQKLGLTDETRDLRDLGDARVAIEALRRLIEVLEGEGERDQASALHATLASMQLAFARVAAEPEAGPPEPESGREKDRARSGADAEAGPEVEGPGAPAPAPAAGTEQEVPAKPQESATRKAGGTRRGNAAKKPATKKPAAKKPSAKKPRPTGPAGDS